MDKTFDGNGASDGMDCKFSTMESRVSVIKFFSRLSKKRGVKMALRQEKLEMQPYQSWEVRNFAAVPLVSRAGYNCSKSIKHS